MCTSLYIVCWQQDQSRFDVFKPLNANLWQGLSHRWRKNTQLIDLKHDSFEDSSQQSSQDWCLWRWHVQLLVELLIYDIHLSTWVWTHQKISSQRSFCPTPTGDQTQRNSRRVVRARTGRLVLGQPSDPGRAVKRKVWSSAQILEIQTPIIWFALWNEPVLKVVLEEIPNIKTSPSKVDVGVFLELTSASVL